MDPLFTPCFIGTMQTANRLVRSATAERMADPDGRPRSSLAELYRELAKGGVGLIVTGHMHVHPDGKAHDEMTGIHTDELIPDLARLARVVHDHGGRIVPQINHGGMNSLAESVSDPKAPSAIDQPFLTRPAREMAPREIEEAIHAFGEAARRCQEAGFDGVQIHAAHGYLISQFLSPFVNRRTDSWGGTPENRLRFLREVCAVVRERVGDGYPVLIKLGMEDGVEGGLSAEEGADIVAALSGMGIDAVEISGGLGGTNKTLNVRKGIKNAEKEAYFLHLARKARPRTSIPIILVGGFRSRSVMERVLADGLADFISLCRPLISEPDLPMQFQSGISDKSRCLSANNCWARGPGEGIACKCPHDRLAERLTGAGG